MHMKEPDTADEITSLLTIVGDELKTAEWDQYLEKS